MSQVRSEKVEKVEKEGEEEEVAAMSVKQRASLFASSQEPTSPTRIQPKKIQRKNVAPRFVTPLTGAMVEPGASITLEAVLDGFPVPEVHWYKNGLDIAEDAERLDVSFGGQKARLAIQDVQESDAGRYTCTARNAAGTASSTADVVIRRTQFP